MGKSSGLYKIAMVVVLCALSTPTYMHAANSSSYQDKAASKTIKHPITKQKASASARYKVPTTKDGLHVTKIIVNGCTTINQDVVILHSGIEPGQQYDKTSIDTALNRIFNTGFFQDVQTNYNNGVLTITVQENPVINKVLIKNNKTHKDSLLLPLMESKPNSFYNKSSVNKDIQAIYSVYDQSGYYGTSVSPKIIALDGNRIDLLYTVKERSKAKISRILFQGNKNFSERKLQDVLVSKEWHIYRILQNTGFYSPGLTAMDEEALTNYYTSNGYVDFRVLDIVKEIAPNDHKFILTYILEEGQVYKVNDITVDNSIDELDDDAIREMIKINSGDTYNSSALSAISYLMEQHISKMGYSFASVKHSITKNQDNNTVNVLFTINKNTGIYINKINISNNTRTRDNVIRREMRTYEGDAYNASKISRSKQRITNLNYFSNVSMETSPTNIPDKVDVDIEVEEKSTGSANLQFGYNSMSGILGMLSLSENNILGTGLYSGVTLSKDKNETDLSVSLSSPYFMDLPIVVGTEFFYNEGVVRTNRASRNNNYSWHNDAESYRKKILGLSERIGYNITEYLGHSIRYVIRHDQITEPNNTEAIIKSAEGSRFTSAVGHSLVYNKRDNTAYPTSGYFVKLSQEFAGLGGSVKYIKNEVMGTRHIALYKNDVILHLVMRAGNISGLFNQQVQLNNNFYLDHDYIRGFDLNGIGPRTAHGGRALGGKSYYTARAEVRFPMGNALKDFGVTGITFLDAASLFSVDISKNLQGTPQGTMCNSNNISQCAYFDSSRIRMSYGAGVIWDSPILGVIKIFYAIPFRKEPFDIESNFGISFSSEF